MKYTNLLNNKSFIAIFALMILISGFSFSNINLGYQKNQDLDIIQNQLDDLISNLEKNNTNSIQALVNDANKNEINGVKSKIKGLDFSDEVIEAFQSLNHDFLEYESILSYNSSPKAQHDSSELNGFISNNKIVKFQEEKDKIKNLYHQNEENFKKICNLHNENHSINNDILNKKDAENNLSTKKYYEEIESLTSDISTSFDTFDKLEKIEVNKKIVKEKLAMIQEMKENISLMKEKIDSIQNKKNALSDKRQNIKEITKKIFNLYNKYLNLDKTINLKAKVVLEKIKNKIDESHKSSETIEKHLSVYNLLIKFYEQINLDKNHLIEESEVEDIKDKFETLGKFISKINNSDSLSAKIR